MNSTSQNPGRKFPFSSGHNAMNDKTLYLTLAASACLGLVFILVLYASVFKGDPWNRLEYGIFMSLVPALGAFVVLKLTTFFASWKGAALVYIALFVLVLIIQGVIQMIPLT